MAASSDKWELSKENIQPLQQGRKPEVLKVSLSSKPEDLTLQQSEYEMRVAAKVMANSEQMQNIEEPSRAAFVVLKPVKKENFASVVRVGDGMVDPSKVAMTIGRQQPTPKSNLLSGRVPFKIYCGENIKSSLPVQSENIAPFVLHSDNSTENGKKPSKWNKVKVKQMPSASRASQSAAPGIKLHSDESSPSQNTPRSVPKVSNIVCVQKEPVTPPLALFVPLDPMKKTMYDEKKVYGGAEEFSLEEIRAAEEFKKKKELGKERKLRAQSKILQEQQEQINRLMQEVQFLKNKQSSSNELDNIPENKNFDKSCSKKFSAQSQFSCFQNDKPDAESSQDTNIASIQKELFPNSKLTSTFREASCIVQDICYNDTIFHLSLDTSGVCSENVRKLNPPQSKTSVPQDKKCLVFHDPMTIAQSDASKENASTEQFEPIPSSKPAIPSNLFQDHAEVISQLSENARLHKASTLNNDFEDEKGDVENIPPKGYFDLFPQETNKRELSGILQPSKNIAFVPLEYQEQEESDEEEDIVYSENNSHLLPDETVIPPCNSEQFIAATFLASIPRTHVKMEQKIPQDENDNSPKSVQPSGEGYNLPPMQSTLDNAACSRQSSKTENKSYVKDHSTLEGYTQAN